MAITYPITLPSSPGFKNVVLRHTDTIKSTISPLSGKQKVLSFDGDRWGITFTLPIMDRVQAAPWHGALASLRNSFGTFKWYNRYQEDIQGSNAGTALINGAGQTGSELLIDGLTFSATGVFLAGDTISLEVSTGINEMKLVLVDADADGAGLATLDVWPPISVSPVDGSEVRVNQTASKEVFGVFRMLSDLDIAISQLGNYEITISAIEV